MMMMMMMMMIPLLDPMERRNQYTASSAYSGTKHYEEMNIPEVENKTILTKCLLNYSNDPLSTFKWY
jgi:hypothetical protein